MLFVLNIKGQAQDTVRQREWPIGGTSIDEATIEWQQDVYRNIDLAKERNAGLYSDNYQEERTSGLFARIFELAIQKKISLYKYEIDGNERLTKKNQTDIGCRTDSFRKNPAGGCVGEALQRRNHFCRLHADLSGNADRNRETDFGRNAGYSASPDELSSS